MIEQVQTHFLLQKTQVLQWVIIPLMSKMSALSLLPLEGNFCRGY